MMFPKKKQYGPKHPGRLSAAKMRAEVWKRHGGRDRATGELLNRTDTNWATLGEVCHLKGRRVMPEWLTDPDHAILLSKVNHILSDGRGGYLLKMLDPTTGEPATDATQPIRFVWVMKNGTVLWERTTVARP
jgi:hypothetical protein